MSTWDDYLDAARRLDAVRRTAVSVAVADTASVQASRQELATVRRRLDLQRGRLLDLARRSGLDVSMPPTTGPPDPVCTPDPACTPDPGGSDGPAGTEFGGSGVAEASGPAPAPALGPASDPNPDACPGPVSGSDAAAGPGPAAGPDPAAGPGPTAGPDPDVGPGPDAGPAGQRGPASGPAPTLRAATADLDAADAILAEVSRPGLAGWPLANRPPARRNAPIYGGFALVALVVQVVLFVTLHDTLASVVATACGALLPVLGFGASWLLIGLVFGPRGRLDRTPLLGAVISTAPIVALCAGIGTLALVH